MSAVWTVVGILFFLALVTFTVVLFVQGARAGHRRRLRWEERQTRDGERGS